MLTTLSSEWDCPETGFRAHSLLQSLSTHPSSLIQENMHWSQQNNISEHIWVILTDKQKKYQSLQMNSGLSYHIRLFVELPVDSSPLTVAKVVFTRGQQGDNRSCWDDFRTTDSASPRQMSAQVNFAVLDLKIQTDCRISNYKRHEELQKLGCEVFTCSTINLSLPVSPRLAIQHLRGMN